MGRFHVILVVVCIILGHVRVRVSSAINTPIDQSSICRQEFGGLGLRDIGIENTHVIDRGSNIDDKQKLQSCLISR